MLTSPQVQSIRRDNAYSIPKQPGEIYNCVVTRAGNDGRVHVHVPELGSDLGPIIPIDTDLTKKYKAGDTLIGTFLTSAMTSFIIFGSTKTTNRSSILIFPTEDERTSVMGETPSVGTFSYIVNTSAVAYWDGTAWSQITGTPGAEGPSGPSGPPGPQGDWSTAQSIITYTTATTAGVLQSSAAGKLVYNTGAQTISVTSATGFSVGQSVDFARLDSNTFTISAGSGATVNSTPANTLRAQYSAASLICTASNVYLLIGDLG
jgi:hypothetical protein